jgi:hypothetical protein
MHIHNNSNRIHRWDRWYLQLRITSSCRWGWLTSQMESIWTRDMKATRNPCTIKISSRTWSMEAVCTREVGRISSTTSIERGYFRKVTKVNSMKSEV